MTGIANDNNYFNQTYYFKMNNWFRLFDSSALSDNHIIIRLSAFMHIFSLGYHAQCVLNFLSFTGLVVLQTFYKILPEKNAKA
jgi:hypothetical protein